MNYLFIFAHPDDESVASAGTIKKLVDNGDKVTLVSVTDGSAGQVDRYELFEEHGVYSIGELRRKEFAAVAQLLGVTDARILNFEDGKITNLTVWGPLTEAIIELIDGTKPDIVITFDHTGWYFHLDHVGVSIATTIAFQQSKHRPHALLLSLFRVDNGKWKYIFPQDLPITHAVDVTEYRQLKQQCYDAHGSQELNHPRKELQKEKLFECYQLVFAAKLDQILSDFSRIFKQYRYVSRHHTFGSLDRMQTLGKSV